MGLKQTRCALPVSVAAVIFLCNLLVNVPHAAAQALGGMSLLDLESARDSFFQSADRNGDFALSTEELFGAMGAANSDLFECWDGDGDGLCSYTEFLESGERVFGELDVDGDGQLSPEEVQWRQ